MFSGVGKLLDRNFIVGYFFPALVVNAVFAWLLAQFGLVGDVFAWSQQEVLKDVTVIALCAWVVAIGFLVLNRHVVRFMEGYWIYNLSAPLKRLQVRRFQALKERLVELDQMYHKPRFQDIEERQKLIEELAASFPGQEGLLLIGNSMTASEDYCVLYHFESIHEWRRIQAVMSKEYRQRIYSGRAIMDLWVNMWFVSLVVNLAYVCLAAYTRQAPIWWFSCAAILLTFLIFQLARDAAERWGKLVKGAFDVYLPALC
jgi:hypothetical protein